MNEFTKVLEITGDSKVELAKSFKELIHTELVLGQTRHVCRYGTLSDGHEKFTPAQRYYQAIKEMWYLGQSVETNRANAMNAQADYLEAEEALEKANSPSSKLRAEAKMLMAKQQLINALVESEDRLRMIDEYNKIRLELQAEVTAKYPHGIEQAEVDSWTAVAKYRAIKENTPYREVTQNIPLSPRDKAKLGVELKRNDMLIPLMVAEQERYEAITDGDAQGVVEFIGNVSEEMN